MDFLKSVIDTIEKYRMLSKNDTVVVGLSGGADSVALFNVLYNLKDIYSLSIHTAHINHMIRGEEANRDMEFAKKTAEEKGVPFHLLECNVPKLAKEKGISEEMAGRLVRYEFFKSIAPNGKIAVAHHMSDSVETTLINLIRGSSLKGLKGISATNGNIIRPLIRCSRDEIENYLASIGASYVTDSTNAENIYTRNKVRNVIIPKMCELNPNIISTIYGNSTLIGDDEDYLSNVCVEYAKKLVSKDEDTVSLNLDGKLHIAIKRRLVLYCANMVCENTKLSSAFVDNVLSLNTGGITSYGNIYAKRSYDRIVFSKSLSGADDFLYPVKAPGELFIPEISKTYVFEILPKGEVTSYENGIIYLDNDKISSLTLRNRKNGDWFCPLGLGGKKKIKDFFIDMKIPRDERNRLPVLEDNGNVVAILCHRADEKYKVTNSTKTILKIYEVE